MTDLQNNQINKNKDNLKKNEKLLHSGLKNTFSP